MDETSPKCTLLIDTSKSWVDQIVEKFNSLLKLKRAIALCLKLLREENIPRKSPYLVKVPELVHVMNSCIKLIQQQYFKHEITWLQSNQEFPKGNKMKSLNPFMDSNGILRVGGRLREAAGIPEEMKHPALLPKNHHLVNLIIQDIHIRHVHAGPHLILALVRSEFWIFGLKYSINKCIKNCVKCQTVIAEIGKQMMGNLPKSRISQTRAFQHVGIDYAGPIHVLPKSGRGQKTMKSWIAVFVCFTTKAVHLELVSELSTDAFMAALKRFTSRRGKPQVIHSDEGTNFKGAKNEMSDFQDQLLQIANHHDVAASLANDHIQWRFNPPGAPHMGGLWEAAVKSMKNHLKRASTSQNFTIEEMCTLLCEIEACLNSRPLTPLSNDPNDFTTLTLGHFLIGEPLLSVPGHDLTHVKMNRLDRWKIIQQQKTHFWNRWSTEYLHTLQNCPKWLVPKVNFKIGDLVIIKDESIAPLKWKMGRIIETHPSTDGIVRVATVKSCTVKINPHDKSKYSLDKFTTTTSVLKRPIHKLVRLPYDKDENLTPITDYTFP